MKEYTKLIKSNTTVLEAKVKSLGIFGCKQRKLKSDGYLVEFSEPVFSF